MHARTTTDTPPGPVDGWVPVLRWPDEEGARHQLAAAGTPRLLLVRDDADAPEPLDDLEDWVRDPARPADVELRARTLLRRRSRLLAAAPHVDDSGLLRYGTRWVALPEAQVPVVELLLRHANEVVRTEDVVAAYVDGGGSGSESSIKALVSRLAPRLRDVGLRLHTVRRRGLILEVPS